MSGPELRFGSRGLCRGAALTLVFASVLATAAATGSLPHGEGRSTEIETRSVAASADRDAVADAAAQAVADGKSGTEAAEEVVSRSGDRWGAVYDEREYQEFEQALDGSYTGVGIAARRSSDGLVAVARVQPGSPAARAGIRAGDVLRTVDGSRVDRRPVSDVVALLRGTVPTRPPGAPSCWVSSAVPSRAPSRCGGPVSPPRPSPCGGSDRSAPMPPRPC